MGRRTYGEAEMVTGLGTRVQRNDMMLRVDITVTYEELRHNPLAKAWVEALENQSIAGHRYVEFLAKKYTK
jgi:hypothetical protein